MKDYIRRFFRAVYRAIRTVFFLVVLFSSLQLAQMEQLYLLCLEGGFSQTIEHMQPPAPPATPYEPALLLHPSEVMALERPAEGAPASQQTPRVSSELAPLEPFQMKTSSEKAPPTAALLLGRYRETKPWWRPIWLLTQPRDSLGKVYGDLFYPAIPLTLSGFIYAFYGLLLGWIFWSCLIGFVLLLKRSLGLVRGGSMKPLKEG